MRIMMIMMTRIALTRGRRRQNFAGPDSRNVLAFNADYVFLINYKLKAVDSRNYILSIPFQFH
jgi:hypothetical protein